MARRMSPLASWALIALAGFACWLFAFAMYANAHHDREDEQ